MTVMIVDDSASIRKMIRTMLSTTADEFCECSDGSEALDSYSRFHPDWVLMDIKMKRMDGFQATHEILSSFPDARVVMITQYNDPKLIEKARRSGARDCILKENLVRVEEIIRKIP